jgi:hypothetical protein
VSETDHSNRHNTTPDSHAADSETEPPPLTWQVVIPSIVVFLLVAGIFGYFLWQLCYSTMHFPDPRHALSPLK